MPVAAKSIRSLTKTKSTAKPLHVDTSPYGYRWQLARKRFLARNPLCVECLKADKLTPATTVDHVIPHRGDMLLFWDSSNWAALCGSHHSKKTARGE
jgi:5-methylcytosine-specific restriction endonuclease McrA